MSTNEPPKALEGWAESWWRDRVLLKKCVNYEDEINPTRLVGLTQNPRPNTNTNTNPNTELDQCQQSSKSN